MSSRFFILLNCILISCGALAQTSAYLDPTGSYTLTGKVTEKNGETYGYFGGVKVVALSKKKILVSLSVCKGAPSYNSGSLVDTLTYLNNKALYKGPQDIDPSCQLSFSFDKKGISVSQKSANPNSACGFGHAVTAQGYYSKLKGILPTKEELLTEEK